MNIFKKLFRRKLKSPKIKNPCHLCGKSMTIEGAGNKVTRYCPECDVYFAYEFLGPDCKVTHVGEIDEDGIVKWRWIQDYVFYMNTCAGTKAMKEHKTA